MNKKIYITTTLPYVNANPHIGHALEFVQADITARYNRMIEKEVFFNTGTDEHGLKIYRKALDAGKTPKEYVDEYVVKFDDLKKALNLSYNNFIRTTDEHHIKATQEFWKRCDENGDIYKKIYKVKYCVGCELEKTDSELDNGKCPIHPNQEIEILEEENYFFRFSKYQKPLLDLYEKNKKFVVPESRQNEIKAFVERGLEDFSISRLKSKMPWGVSVPNDDEQVMYVWFDALVNYISAIGWPSDDKFKEWWPVVQFAGKDNLRQQSAMWQAMLMSAGIEPSRQIFIHGFITSGGQKMSKSIGNVVNPYDVIKEYSTDALRYYLAREIPPFEDGDFTNEKFKEVYNANLANGLGNLVSRILKMSSTYEVKTELVDEKYIFKGDIFREYSEHLDNFRYNEAMDIIWKKVGDADNYIQENQPFKTIKTNEEKAKKDVAYLVSELWIIAVLLSPFIPETSEKIKTAIKENKMPSEPLFLRKD